MKPVELLSKLRERNDKGAEAAAGLALAALAANVLGLLFTVVLARVLGPVDYGALAALVSAFLIVSIAGSALQITVAREVSVEFEQHDPELGQHVRGWVARLLAFTAVTVVIGVVLRDPISELIGVEDDPWAASVVLATGAAWLLLSVLRGALQGFRRFQPVALSIIGEAALRLVIAVVLVTAGLGVTGGFLGSLGAILAMAAILLFSLREALRDARSEGRPSMRDQGVGSDYGLLALVRRTWPALLALTMIAILQNSDVIMVKRAADETVAGAYAADAVAAKVIIWIAIGLGFYVVPESARLGAGREARRVLMRTLALIGVAGGAMVAIYAVAGETMIRLAFGPEYAGEASSLPILGLAMVMLSLTYLMCQFLLALEKVVFLAILALGVAVQLTVLPIVAESPYDTATAMLAIQAGVAIAIYAASRLFPERVSS